MRIFITWKIKISLGKEYIAGWISIPSTIIETESDVWEIKNQNQDKLWYSGLAFVSEEEKSPNSPGSTSFNFS